jgi:hypothetical protein
MWNNHQVNQHYGQYERNKILAKEKENKRNFRLGCLMVLTPVLILIILAFFMPKKAVAADNSIIIDQVGSYNTINISQDGSGHYAKVVLGAVSAVDNTAVSIDQKDSGLKYASVRINSGVDSGVNILQQGSGNHSAIMTLNGSGNNINIDQNGAGNHEFRVLNSIGSTNSGNTITSTQSSASSQIFNLTLDGATGATVGVSQTGAIPNIGSMTIQCAPSTCGTYTYTRN